MSESTTNKKQDEIKYLKNFPLLDSETNEVVPGLGKVYFDAELPYRIIGKRQDAVPVNTRIRAFFAEYNKPMSPTLAREWIFSALKRNIDPISVEHLHLDDLVLDREGEQEIHTIKAKGKVYYKGNIYD